MFSSSFNAQPSIDRPNGTRRAPGGTSGDVITLAKIQLVPLLKYYECENAVHGDVVGPWLAQAIDEPLHLHLVEQIMQTQTFGAERLAHPRLQMPEHPRSDRHQEAFFRTENHLLGKISRRRALQQVLRLAVADLDAARQRRHEFDHFGIEKR